MIFRTDLSLPNACKLMCFDRNINGKRDFKFLIGIIVHCTDRPVVPGCAGCAMAHPDFGKPVNPISTRGDRLCQPNYYWHTRIFRPSDGPAKYYNSHFTNILGKVQNF